MSILYYTDVLCFFKSNIVCGIYLSTYTFFKLFIILFKKPYFINPRYRNSILAYFQYIKVLNKYRSPKEITKLRMFTHLCDI